LRHPSSLQPNVLLQAQIASSAPLGSSASEQEISWLGQRPSLAQISLFASPTAASSLPKYVSGLQGSLCGVLACSLQLCSLNQQASQALDAQVGNPIPQELQLHFRFG